MDIKSALKAALPQEIRALDRGPGSLHARIVEFAEHLEELGALWLLINHSSMVTGHYRKNQATGQLHQWHENFRMQGEDPNQVRKALNRFLETNRPDTLAAVYDDLAKPPVDRVTPVLARLQAEIYQSLDIYGSYTGVDAVGYYRNPKLPQRWTSKPMHLRCAVLFLKRYDESTDAEKRKAVLKRVVARLHSTDTVSANNLRKTHQALGGDSGELEFSDERQAKYRAERNKEREAWLREQED